MLGPNFKILLEISKIIGPALLGGVDTAFWSMQWTRLGTSAHAQTSPRTSTSQKLVIEQGILICLTYLKYLVYYFTFFSFLNIFVSNF